MPEIIGVSKNIWNFDPTTISGCQSWLDASDSTTITYSSGSNVSLWKDKAPYGNYATMLQGTPTLVSNAIGGLSAIYLNGSSALTGFCAPNTTNNLTVFAVFTAEAGMSQASRLVTLIYTDYNKTFSMAPLAYSSNSNTIRVERNSVGVDATSNAITLSTPSLAATTVNGATTTVHLNGTQILNSTAFVNSNFGYGYYTIGCFGQSISGNAYQWKGYVGEVILYSNALSTAQRQQVEGYLAYKWTLASTLPAFVNPGSITGLQIWMDAQDAATVTVSGSNVTRVGDKSSNNLNFTGATGFSYPNNTFNGTYPSFYTSTSRTNANLGTNAISLSQPLTVFFVGLRLPVSSNYFDGYVFDGTNSTNRIYQYGDYYLAGALTNTAMSPGRIIGTPVVITTIFNTTNSSQYLLGTTVNSNVNGGTSNMTSGIRVANSFGVLDNFVGHFCEFIIYNKVLPTIQRQQVEYYLANKWGLLSVSAFAPNVISNCLFWFDAADTSAANITRSGTQVTAWANKGNSRISATNFTGVITSGTATYNGRNILQSPAVSELRFTESIAYQARAWFAVFRQTTQLSNAGGPIQQYFVIVNQTVGNGQDGIAGPMTPTNYTTSSYEMGEGASGIAAWINTGRTVPNGYNVFGIYSWINSAVSTAANRIAVNGTSYALTASTLANSYNTGSIAYTINTAVYSNACDIAEIILINGEITTTQRQQIEYYLANKWGISGPSTATYGPPQVSTAPVTNSYYLPATHPFVRSRPHLRVFQPRDVDGCVLWLDGADPAGNGVVPANGDAVTTWVDKSGGGYNATANGTAATYASGGGIVFAGAQNYGTSLSSTMLTQSGFAVLKYVGSSRMDIISVNSISGTAGLQQIINAGSQVMTSYAGSTILTGAAVTPNVPVLYNYTFSSGVNAFIYLNGAQTGTSTGGSISGSGTISIGSYNNNGSLEPLTGTIYEILLYNVVVTSTQRQQVENYLVKKWNISIPVPGYTTTSPSLTNCKLWLDGADILGTGAVAPQILTTWADKSGTSNTVTANGQTTIKTGRGPFINGANWFSVTGGLVGSIANVPFVVIIAETPSLDGSGYLFGDDSTNSGTNNALHIGYRNSGNFTFAFYANDLEYYSTFPNAVTRVWAFYLPTSTNRNIRLNGSTVATHTDLTRLGTFSTPVLGRVFGGNNYVGVIHEVLVYNADIGLTAIQAVENYLIAKWQKTSTAPSYSIPTATALPFLPTNITGSALWLDAADATTLTLSGSNVTQWNDKSGNSANGVAIGTPSYNSSSNGITFNGSSAFSLPNGTISPGSSNFTIFVMCYPTSFSGYPYVYGAGTTTADTGMALVFYPTGEVENGFYTDFMGIAPAGTVAINNQYMFTSFYNGTRTLYKNGTSVVSGTPTGAKNISTTTNRIGCSQTNASYFYGIINEMIVYNAALTTTQRQQVEGYLAWKWNLMDKLPSTHLYRVFPPGHDSSTAVVPVSYSNFLWTRFYNIVSDPSINGPGSSGWGSLIGTAGAYNPVNFQDGDARIGQSDFVGVISKGFMYSASATVVTFQTVSDDGIVLFFNGNNVLQNWTYHGDTVNYSASVTLPAGYTPIELRFFEWGGGFTCELYWSVGSTGTYTADGTGRMFYNSTSQS